MATRKEVALHIKNKALVEAISHKAYAHKDPFTGELFSPKTVREANLLAMGRLQHFKISRFNDLYPTFSEIELQICVTLQKIMVATTLHEIEVACREDKSYSDGGHIWVFMDMIV